MIQEEFKDLIFKFAKHASVDKVAYIFLFGSVAKGDADRRSDIDILVALDTDNRDFEEIEAKKIISEMALTLENEYDRNIQVVFTNRNYDGLDEYFINKVMREGILLYAISPKIEVNGLNLEPYELILYNLKNMINKDKMRIKRLLYGHKTKKEVDGKIYKSEKKGLVQELDAKHIGPGMIAVPQKGIKTLEGRLEKWNIDYKRIDMWLPKDGVIKIHI